MFPILHNFAKRHFPKGAMPCGLLLLLAGCFLLLCSSLARAQYRADLPDTSTPAPIPNLPIVEKPNAKIPLDLEFTRAGGATVKLADCFLHDKPVILALVYFSCPNLCGISQDSLISFVRQSPHGIQLGKDYDILIVSIDSDDTSGDAAKKRKNYLGKVPLPESQPGFTYLTGSRKNIQTLADTVGFPFRINPPGSDAKISHDSGIFICTPDGRLSQTILGIDYQSDQLHNALRIASGGKVGSGLLSFAISCGAMKYDPKLGYIHNPWFYAGTATGILSIAFMATFLTILWRGEAKRKKTSSPTPTPIPPS